MIGTTKRGLVALGLSSQTAKVISPPHGLYLINASTFLKVCKPYVKDSKKME
jgi:hypothetical protein